MCERCLDPALALPSYRIYRGSLLALLVGSVFAVWLLVRPISGEEPDAADAELISTATQTAGDVTDPEDGSPTPAATSTQSAGATSTATASPTATPTATATPETDVVEYTVAPGDTLQSIAQQFLPAGADLTTFTQSIAAFNGIADPSLISVGQVIRIPPS